MATWFLFLLVGAAGGFTAGLFGVGGGLIIVPTLYVLWRSDPVLGAEVMHFAVATSLACVVVTSLTSSWTHWRSKRLQLGGLTWLAAAVSLGAATAVWMANWLPSSGLKVAFGLFALGTGLTMWRKPRTETAVALPRKTELLGAGTLIGHVSTLLGVSGGAMTVPYLVLRGTDLHQAVVMSSAVAIPISLIGSVGFGLTGPTFPQTWGYVHLEAFLGISAVSLFFSRWGAQVSQQMDKQRLRLAFALYLTLVAVHMLGF